MATNCSGRTAMERLNVLIPTMAITALSGCIHDLPIGPHPSEPTPICTRYVDSDGFLRGRDSLYNTAGAKRVLAAHPYSHRGTCKVGAQGPAARIDVCLAKSSPCRHDRTTNVWEDQWPWYQERYPGSHRGECQSECSTHEDDCLKGGEIDNE